MTHIEFTGSGGISSSFPTPGAEKAVVVQNGTGKVVASLTSDGAKKTWLIKHGLNTMAITGSLALNRPMYVETVKATAGLIAYWRMDEANEAKSVVGSLNSEALGQTVPAVAGANLPGDLDKANEFKAEAANIFTLATTATLELKKELSVECLVKPATGATAGIFEKSVAEATNSSYLLFIESAGKATFRVFRGAALTVQAPIALSTTEYSHVVGTYEPLLSKIYVNGKLEAEKTITAGELTTGAGKSYIGALAPGTLVPLKGNIDELAIYNKPLSAAQAAEHAAQVTIGRPGEVQALTAEKKIVALTPNEVEVTYNTALNAGEILWVTLIG